MPEQDFDVAICGGGLAGLTLSLQLRRRRPDARVVVFEPTRRPLPEACHKVGESSVEVGARYFGEILGLHEHLLERHLWKNGLRFFSGPARAPFVTRAEMGPREPPNVPAYQIDRGRFENDLRAMCVDAGVDLREGWGVRDVVLEGEGPHTVHAVELGQKAEPESHRARWVVDASGRRQLLAKKLGLRRPLTPQASAAWFRVPERIDVADLADGSARGWHDRDIDHNRWRSTNHLCGPGYWVWLIPLSNGHTSVGLVAENQAHEYPRYASEPTMRAWLEEHEPELARRLAGVPFADFIAMKDYRYFASQAFSADRWACVGEAALFVDPLYSPGSDVIGLGNCMVSELIETDLAGGGVDPARVESLEALFLSWTAMLGRTLAGGSMVFGTPEVLGAKLYWDYFYYWAMLCPYFFSDLYRLAPSEHGRFVEMLARWRRLNERAQDILSAWSALAPREPDVDLVGLPQPATMLSDLHLELLERRDPDATYAAMERNLAWGEEIVLEILLRALRRAGPARAAELARTVDLPSWREHARVSEPRLRADEATPRDRRKLLSKPVRDMERSIGKNAAAGSDAPRLRELWSLALG